MQRSMTGYAKVYGDGLAVEIHSVNKRGLDVYSCLPKELLWLDVELKKWVSEAAFRGQVTIRIYLNSLTKGTAQLDSLKKVDMELKKLAHAVGFQEERPYSFSFLLEEAEKQTEPESDRETLLVEIAPVVKQAIQEWTEAKLKEGRFLTDDLEKRLLQIEKTREKILNKKDTGPDRLRERLMKVLEELTGKLSEEDQRRLLKEVVIYAEKADIAEELTRLEAHLRQFRAVLRSEKSDVGKTLDFFVQEMLRETNTIGSKSTDIDIIHNIVEIKGELEKIREQVQNIE